ncbi:unnamed protein product [Protopolystoma xenopodis]|uniref:Uncharacterized protein n=1 Tax=Protopolystoma xenopodis TaxID=117903 RepID=A0A448WMP4_9PLAT|nr:unnamed protein product [Protopolystoma xenopodis]
MGLSFIVTIGNVAEYFDVYRNFSLACISSGIGIGTTLMPLVTVISITGTNWRIGFITLASVYFHMMVICALSRPLPPPRQSPVRLICPTMVSVSSTGRSSMTTRGSVVAMPTGRGGRRISCSSAALANRTSTGPRSRIRTLSSSSGAAIHPPLTRRTSWTHTSLVTHELAHLRSRDGSNMLVESGGPGLPVPLGQPHPAGSMAFSSTAGYALGHPGNAPLSNVVVELASVTVTKSGAGPLSRSGPLGPIHTDQMTPGLARGGTGQGFPRGVAGIVAQTPAGRQAMLRAFARRSEVRVDPMALLPEPSHDLITVLGERAKQCLADTGLRYGTVLGILDKNY